KVFISKNKLLESLNIVNGNYLYGKYNKNELAQYTSISDYSIKDFYGTTDGVLKRNLETALKSLKDKSLIFYSEIVTVTVAETDAQINKENKVSAVRHINKNSRGKREVSFDVTPTFVKSVTRKATEREACGIL